MSFNKSISRASFDDDTPAARIPCDLFVLFRVLRNDAKDEYTLTYTDLSHAYHCYDSTPRPQLQPRAWSPHLLELSRVLEKAGLPTITGIVVSAVTGMPSENGSWGLPGAPAAPDWDAFVAYRDDVFRRKWPDDLPGLTRL